MTDIAPAGQGTYDPGFEPRFVDGDGHAWYCVGYNWVDTGKLILTDPGYVQDFVSDEPSPGSEWSDSFPYSYAGASAAIMFDEVDQLGEGRGVSLSMPGDGIYALLGRYDHEGRIIEVRLRLDAAGHRR